MWSERENVSWIDLVELVLTEDDLRDPSTVPGDPQFPMRLAFTPALALACSPEKGRRGILSSAAATYCTRYGIVAYDRLALDFLKLLKLGPVFGYFRPELKSQGAWTTFQKSFSRMWKISSTLSNVPYFTNACPYSSMTRRIQRIDSFVQPEFMFLTPPVPVLRGFHQGS